MHQHQWLCRTLIYQTIIGSVVISAASLVAANATAATYKVVEIAKLDQGTPAVVRGLNSAGVAAGGGKDSSIRGPNRGRRGLLFRNGIAALPIDGPAGSDSTTVFGLNDSGGFVGTSNTPTAVRAFAGTSAGAVKALPPLGGDSGSAAFALNLRGQAVGFSTGPAGQRAVTWDVNGTPAALPVSSAMSNGRATGINLRGDIVGAVQTAQGRRPVVWPGGLIARELVLPAGHVTGEALAVNAGGDVVGYSADPAGARRATLWLASGAVTNLGTLPGGNFSQAFDSNNAGDIVGTSSSSAGARAFLWTRSGGLQDLNSLIPPINVVLTKAVGINNLGMIVATGHDAPAGQAAAPHADDGHGHDDAHESAIRVFLLVP